MKYNNITITGASGYIGRHVVSNLLNRGVPVTAVDLNTCEIDPRAIRIGADIFSADENIYEKLNRPEIVLHLAWQDGFKHNSSNHILNLPKHFQFIDSLIKGGVKQIAIMGTMHEVGYWEGEVDENTPTNPISYYGIAKNCLRQIVRTMAEENKIIFQWLRAFYILGDDQKNNSIFSKILNMENEGKSLFPFTDGKNKYDFIQIDEVANQIALCVLQDEINGIINCCSGTPIALRDMVEKFIQEKNLKIKPAFGQYPSRPYDSPAIWGNVDKIQTIIENSKK